MEIFNIKHDSGTELEQDSHWVSYECKEDEKVLVSWYIVPDNTSDEELKQMIKEHIEDRGGVANFPNINSLDDFLMENIIECHNSENEMWFVEYREVHHELGRFNFNGIWDCIKQHNLEEYIELEGSDTFLTVYGGISTVINWKDYLNTESV